MLRTIGLCALAALVSASAWGTTYDWDCASAANYTDPTAWTGNAAPANSTTVAGSANIVNKGSGGGACNVPNATTVYIGELNVNNGAFGSGNFNLFVLDDCGMSGNLTVSGTGQMNDSTGTNWYVDGNASFSSTAFVNNVKPFRTTLYLQGSGKTIEDCDTSYWNSVVVASGASYTTAPTGNGHTLRVKILNVQGTLNGPVTWTPSSATITAPTVLTLGPSAQFNAVGNVLTVLPVSGTTYALLGGGAYYDVQNTLANNDLPSGYNRPFVRLRGSITAHNFTWGGYAGNNIVGRYLDSYLNTDNGSGVIGNLTTTGAFQLGGTWSATPDTGKLIQHMLVANSSTFTIGGDASFKDYGAVTGGTSTWNFNGNVSFDRTLFASGPRNGLTRFKFDNSTMTGATFNVVGAKRENLALTSLLKLGNLNIGSPSVTGTLAHLTDNVLLVGNLRVYANNGLNMDCNAGWVNLGGGQGTWGTAQTIELDNTLVSLRKLWVKQGSPTWVKLLSNVTLSDNIDIDPNCILFTNGFTLTVNGGFDQGTYGPSTLAYTTHTGGLILVSGVPEPATLLLLGSGVVGAVGWMRRRRMTK